MRGMEYRSDVADVESDLFNNPDNLAKACEDIVSASGAMIVRSNWIADNGSVVLTTVLKGGTIVIQALVDEGLMTMNVLTFGPPVDAFRIMDGILSLVGGRPTFRDSAGRFRDLLDRKGW